MAQKAANLTHAEEEELFGMHFLKVIFFGKEKIGGENIHIPKYAEKDAEIKRNKQTKLENLCSEVTNECPQQTRIISLSKSVLLWQG